MKTIALHLLCAVAIGAGNIALAQATKLRFASVEPPTAPLTSKVFTPWAKDTSEGSGGTLEIEMFAGGVLGRNVAQQLKLVQDGVVDIAWIIPSFTPGRFGGLEVVELPFVVQTVNEGSIGLNRLFAQGLLSGFDDLKVLLLCTNSPQFISSRTPIKALADLKGKRLRATGAIRSKAIEALGAVPVQLAPTQVAESLSKGVVDATLGEWLFVTTFRVEEVAGYHFEMPLGVNALAVVMQKARFDALPLAARAAIERFSGGAYVQRYLAVFNASDAETRERIGTSGRNQITVPAATEVDAWRKATQGVVDGWRQESAQNERLYQALDAELVKMRSAR